MSRSKQLDAFVNDVKPRKVKLPAPAVTEYQVQLPDRSQIAIEPPDGHELCVRREAEHVVVFTRRLPKEKR